MEFPQADLIERIRNLRSLYMNAHRDGMACLEAGDLAGFGEAIQRERDILEDQQALLDEWRRRGPGF